MGLDMYLHTATGKEVAYWRKANAIHRYLSEKGEAVEGEKDVYEVSRHTLLNLCLNCANVLRRPYLSEAILPTMDGPFFGPTDYGEFYREGLADTVENVLLALVENDDKIFYYYAWY